MVHPILNLADLEYERTIEHGDRFEARLAPVGERIGANKLAYNVTAVPPGKRAFPKHNHHVNEELFFILEGEGTLRFGEAEHPVKTGDFICCPAGGTDVAHQIVNTGAAELRFIALGTAIETDVFQYPDSGKFGFATGRPNGGRVSDSRLYGFYREDSKVPYFDGE